MPEERYVVIDGSNIATEGRSQPRLVQLDEAVRAFQHERPDAKLIVVVDATFGHRIDASERRTFEEGEAAGELVSPPAGAIGRGDKFLLQVADRVGATVLSNDSFQEFHGEYEWLFEEGRLIGGKPVPGVGWIFTTRVPVRGPTSRVAVRAAKQAKKADKAPDKKLTEAAAPQAEGGGQEEGPGQEEGGAGQEGGQGGEEGARGQEEGRRGQEEGSPGQEGGQEEGLIPTMGPPRRLGADADRHLERELPQG